MDREEIKAISLQGIVHKATKIGVQDGQCEDLVNLRFKDGSWRTSGEGKHVFSMNYQSDVSNTTGISYTQLFIHTNVYRHMLGVRNDKLYWFGNINADGEFETLSTPKELAPANNDLYICQTGHLLTVIDGDSFTYLLFKSSNNDYKALNVDLNGSQDSRTLYPFGQIHFNYADAGEAGTITEDKTGQDGWRKWGLYKDWGNAGQDIYTGGGKLEDMSGGGAETLHNTMVKMYGEILEKNYFTDPFLVCAAIKLYDGKYMYASAPAMIFPRQCAYNTATSRYVHKEPTNTTNSGYDELTSDAGFSHSGALLIPRKEVDASKIKCHKIGDNSIGTVVTLKGTIYGAVQKQTSVDLTNENGYTGSKDYQREHARQGGEDIAGSFRNGICAHTYCIKGGTGGVVGNQYSLDGQYAWQFQIRGCNLCVSIDSSLVKVMNDNKDLFKSLCIFITPQSSVYKMDVKDKGGCRVTLDVARSEVKNHLNVTAILRSSVANMSYIPNRREDKDIRYDLLHSPFYLLREYTQDELPNLLKNPVVDLQDPQFEGVLKNITQQDTLKVEAVNRYSYIPKVQYTYNGRLHIANYTQSQFHGYPIDVYHLNNHSLEYDAVLDNFRLFKGSLPYLKSFYDDTLSEKRIDHFLSRYAGSQLVTAVKKAGDVSAYVEVECDTDDGTQRVSRYIPFTPKKTINGYADFIETLDPLLTFPDSRAKKMTISILESTNGTTMTLYKNEFKLEAHPYLNIAYYLDDSLKPISLDKVATKSVTEYQTGAKPSFNQAPKETNTTESYPNGLKVSATNNPMYFPVENTYQVGAAEIVAMMSNAIAVGIGQTGSAPLYVFCKDGVYAMFVDETGEMTYANSRIIARDVCNNARSVTPIDTGVVFTTDRGLMEIVGEQVTEIGQPLEGDWVKYTTQNHIDFSKIAKNAYYMKRIAALPDDTTLTEDSMTQVDFLEYVKGSIINYNHNERELMVSNPAYCYTYILDREGNWSRRDIRAEQYVNNYPTSYRIEKGELYQVDKDSDADNGFFAMSHIVKLDSIGFKEIHRLIVRGYWETISKKEYKTIEIPESKQTLVLSPAQATITGWNEQTNTTEYIKTIHEELYHLDIPAQSHETELQVELAQAQTLSLKCVDGCRIDTTKNNNITVTYQIINTDTSEVLNEETFDAGDIAENEIVICCGRFSDTETIEDVPYKIIMTLDAQIYLIGDNGTAIAEFEFERYREGDGFPAHHTEFEKMTEIGVDFYKAKVNSLPASTAFDHGTDSNAYFADEETDTGYDRDNYLVIPEGCKALLEITIPQQTTYWGTRDTERQCIVTAIRTSSTSLSFGERAFFSICKVGGGIYFYYASNANPYTSAGETETIVQTTEGSYTVCGGRSIDISSVTKIVELPAGKYYQQLMLPRAILTEQQTIYDLEFGVNYKCTIYKSNAAITKSETTTYVTDGVKMNDHKVMVPSEVISDNGETAALHSINANITIPILDTENTSIVQYNSTDGTITSFTIPVGHAAKMRMKLYGSDNGLKMTITGYKTEDGTIAKLYDEFDSTAGNGIFLIRNDKGQVFWSSDMKSAITEVGGDCAAYFYLPDEYDSSSQEQIFTLPAGTYRMEVVVSDTKLCTDTYSKIEFKFDIDMDITVTLEVSSTTDIANTFGMQELVLPSIAQQLVSTIPAHTEQVIDPDKTYDTILGLYVFGSYDGRKWACIGHREKSGEFRDIGTLVERTDCRFFRFILAGQVSKDSRLDYFEVSSRQSKLSTKIR